MEIVSVIAAAAAAWIFGAVWYGIVGRHWMEAAGLTQDTINRRNYIAFVGSFICCVLVAGMMRHVLVTSNVFTVSKGAITGLGLGLFIAVPWIATNYMFAERRFSLTLIDGGHWLGVLLIQGALIGFVGV